MTDLALGSARRGTVSAGTTLGPANVHFGRLRSVAIRGSLLLGEVVAVPGAILSMLVAIGHPMAGLAAVFAWRAMCIGTRLALGSRVPATCWLAFALFLTRTIAGLAASSISLYLLIPVVLCAFQGVFFLVSTLAHRPAMMRFAADYVEEIPDHPALRGLFSRLSGIWGGIHLACACGGAWALTLPAADAVAATSAIGIACTGASVGVCILVGLRCATHNPGLRLVFGETHSVASCCAEPTVPMLSAGPSAPTG